MGRLKRVATPSTPLTNLPIIALDDFEKGRSLFRLAQTFPSSGKPLTNLPIIALDDFEKVFL